MSNLKEHLEEHADQYMVRKLEDWEYEDGSKVVYTMGVAKGFQGAFHPEDEKFSKVTKQLLSQLCTFKPLVAESKEYENDPRMHRALKVFNDLRQKLDYCTRKYISHVEFEARLSNEKDKKIFQEWKEKKNY